MPQMTKFYFVRSQTPFIIGAGFIIATFLLLIGFLIPGIIAVTGTFLYHAKIEPEIISGSRE